MENKLHYAILKYIKGLADKTNDASLQTGVEYLSNGFNLYITPENDQLYTHDLPSIFYKATETNYDPVLEKKFDEYKDLLTSRNYFANTTPGSAEYEERLRKAREKFFEKFKNEQSSNTTTTTTTTNIPDTPVSDEAKREAETLKVRGNEAFKGGDFQGAIDLYTSAVALYPNAIYYCNRGTAYTKLQQHTNAESDYLQCIALDPKYVKAYDRLGYTYIQIGNLDKAIEAFKNGLTVEPNNQDLLNHLAQAEEQRSGGMGGMPNMPNFPNIPGMPNMPAGMPNFQELLNNPQVMQNLGPIQNMLNNPQFMEMTMQLMENPNFQGIIQNMMNNPAFANMLGGLNPPPGGNQ